LHGKAAHWRQYDASSTATNWDIAAMGTRFAWSAGLGDAGLACMGNNNLDSSQMVRQITIDEKTGKFNRCAGRGNPV
jgi:hypothetical protein